MQDLEKKYLDYLRNECQRIILTNEMKIIEFLYKIIYNRDYFELTKYDENLENQLDHKICEQILYPFKSDAIITIQQAIILIPGYASFFMGTKIILNQIIHEDSAQFWDFFMNACAFKVNMNNDKHDIQIAKFQELLQIENKQYLALNLPQSEQLIDNFLKPNQLLKLLNIFFQDCFLFNVQSQYEKTSAYLQFLGEKKKQHFLNVLNFIIYHFYEEINGSYDFQKLKISQSFILKDYCQEYLYSSIDLYTRGMIIYSLIEYDYKQFTCILNFLSNQEKIQIIDRIIYSIKDYNSEYIKLILAAKCLKNVGDWEQSEKLFQLILNKKQETTKKYSVYIYLSLAKLRLFQGDLNNSLKHNSKAISIIDQFSSSQLDYYKPNINKDLLIEALMRGIVLAVYLNQKNIIETKLIRLKNIISQSDSYLQKRPVTLIFQRFIQLIIEFKQPFNKNEKKALQDFSIIQTNINQLLQQRVQYTLQQKPILNMSIFNKLFQKSQHFNEQTYFPPNIYKLYNQLMILNVLLYKSNIPADIYYVDVRYYQIFYKIIKNTDLYNDSIKSQLFFNLSHFEDALEIAKRYNDHKLMGQIYEYQGNLEQALIHYQKIFDTDCYFNIANIFIINGKYAEAVSMLNRLKQLSPQYQQICAGYILKAQKNSSQSLYYSQRRNNLIGSGNDYDFPLRKAKTNEFIKIEQPRILNVETILEQDDPQIENDSDSLIQTTEIPAFENEFEFQLRDDIQYFYTNLMNTCWNKTPENVQILKDFVMNTRYLETESSEFSNQENFQVGQRIGAKSTQGKVNLVTYLGKQYASKITSFSFQTSGEYIRQENIDAMKERLFEIIIQSRITQLNYPYTPHLKHLGFQFIMVGEDKVIRIFTLTDYFQPSSRVHTFDNDQKMNFCFKLAIILNMLQTDLKIIHQDLKPDNILVSEYDPVLIDYGISQTHTISQKTVNFQDSTTRYQDQEYSRTFHKSKKNDVYSFGATIYNLITNELPFSDKTPQQLIGHEFDFFKYHENTISKIQNHFLQEIIRRCTSNFNERPYFSEVIYLFLEHLFGQQDLTHFLKMLSFDFRTCNVSLQNIESMKIILKNYPEYQLPQQVNHRLKKNIDEVLSHVIVNSEEMLVFNYQIQLQINQNMELIQQQIYQYVHMIANWITLKDNPYIAKLRYFSIKCERPLVTEKQNQSQLIKFSVYLKSYELLSTQIVDWKQFTSQILTSLKEIHKSQIILLNIQKNYLFCENNQIIIASLSLSQNINNSLRMTYDNIDPLIKESRKLSFENDVYALGILLKSLFAQNNDLELDQMLSNIFMLNNGNRLTIDEFIDKLKI